MEPYSLHQQITAFRVSHAGLEIRVVLWPQSTRTSGGPPDSAMWWSGGLLETLTINFDNIFKMCTYTFYDQCNIFFNTIYLLQGIYKCLVW